MVGVLFLCIIAKTRRQAHVMSPLAHTLHSLHLKECTMAQDLALFARPSTLGFYIDRCLAFVVAKPQAKVCRRPLVCHKRDLQDIVIANDVEAEARVLAAQRGWSVPFGPRNPAWKAFKASLLSGDIVWRFESPDSYGGVLRGYAAVRNQQVVAEFVECRQASSCLSH